MKNRKTFAMICYFISILACIGAGAVSFMAYSGKLSYTLGFLIFVPIWIISYWFLGFFNALAREKNGKKIKFVVKKALTKGLSTTANIISILLICFWVYAYIFKVMPANTTKNSDSKAEAAKPAAAVVTVDR